MQFKNYIAAFFVVVFLGKMISVDAKLLGMILDNSQVTLVNKLCPKKQLQMGSAEEFSADSFTSSFEVDYLCHVVFDMQLQDLSETIAENNFEKYTYRDPGSFSEPSDKFYPPPKA